MSAFANRLTLIEGLKGIERTLQYHGPPPASDTADHAGAPANAIVTQQVRKIVTSKWTGEQAVTSWGDRRQWAGGSNKRPNLLGPQKANGQLLKRIRPIGWSTGLLYYVGEKVYNNSISWVCLVEHTSGGFSSDLNLAYWAEITDPLEREVECRVEYSTFKRAIGAVLIKNTYLAGLPVRNGGKGYRDLADTLGLTQYTWDEAEADSLTVFPNRPYDPSPTSNALAQVYAVNTDISVLHPMPLCIDYTWGGVWTAGQFVTDLGTLLCDTATGDGWEQHWTNSQVGAPGLPPASTLADRDDPPEVGVSLKLVGASQNIRTNGVITVNPAETYVVTAHGQTEYAGSFRITATCMDANYAIIGTQLFEPYTLSPSTLAGGFEVTRKWAASSGTNTTAWAVGTVYIRFGVLANIGGSAGSVTYLRSLRITKSTTVPKPYKVLAAHTSGMASMASERAGANAAKWATAKTALQVDYECGDLRPADAAEDTEPGNDGNTTYLCQRMREICDARGIEFHLYTSDLSGQSNVAFNNGVKEANLNDILGYSHRVNCITDGDNYAFDDGLSLIQAIYKRLRYTNGLVSNGQRSNWDVAKLSIAAEQIEKGISKSIAVSGFTVGAGPGYVVAVQLAKATFKQELIPDGSDVYIRVRGIRGLGPVAALDGTFKGQMSGSGTENAEFEISHKITGINPLRGTATETVFSGAGLGSYLGGGTLSTRGFSIFERFNMYRWSRAVGMRHWDLWRGFAVQGTPTLDAPYLDIISITNDVEAVVKTKQAHGLGEIGEVGHFYIINAGGLDALNNSSHTAVVVDDHRVKLSNMNTTVLPRYTGGGLGRDGRVLHVNRAMLVEGFGWGRAQMQTTL